MKINHENNNINRLIYANISLPTSASEEAPSLRGYFQKHTINAKTHKLLSNSPKW